jgi:hypothetical protein
MLGGVVLVAVGGVTVAPVPAPVPVTRGTEDPVVEVDPATPAAALLDAVDVGVLVVGVVPLACCENGSRPRPVSREFDGVVCTSIAGSDVAGEGGGVPCGACARGGGLDEFESTNGTAAIATTSPTANGHSRFSRSSVSTLRATAVTTVKSKFTFIGSLGR